MLEHFIQVDEQLKALELEKKELTAQLLDYYDHLNHNEKNQALTGLYTFKPVYMTNQTRFNQTLFKEENNELYSSYLMPIDDYSYIKASSIKKVVK